MKWLEILGLAMLACNAAVAVYRSVDDMWSVTFVVVSTFALFLLFWCLRLFERAATDSTRRMQLKAAIWSLCTLIMVMFTYKVAALMPWPVAIVVWATAVTVPVGGFYTLFISGKGN